MIFLSLVNLYLFQNSEQVKLYLYGGDKILSSLIKKAWCPFLNHFNQANEQELSIRPVSIESTLLLFRLIQHLFGLDYVSGNLTF